MYSPGESRVGRLMQRTAESNIYLSTPKGILAGIAGASLVTLSDAVLVAPGLSITMPLALVVFGVAWFSTAMATATTVVTSLAIWEVWDTVEKGYLFDRSAFLLMLIRLSSLAVIGFLVHQLRRALRAERANATHDSLTGVLNRRGFEEAAEREIARSERERTPLFVALLDIDGLKRLNDEQGHRAGDDALRRFADHARSRLRSTDIIGRVGGDEFAVLGSADDVGTRHVLADLLEAPSPDGQGPVRTSIGAVVYLSGAPDLEVTMGLADQLMYAAKTSGDGMRVEVARS